MLDYKGITVPEADRASRAGNPRGWWMRTGIVKIEKIVTRSLPLGY